MTRALDTLAKLARRRAETAAQAMRPVREAISALETEALLSETLAQAEREAAGRLSDPRDLPSVLAYMDRVQRQASERQEKITSLEAQLQPMRAAVVSAWQDEERYRDLARMARQAAETEQAARDAAALSEAALLKALRDSQP